MRKFLIGCIAAALLAVGMSAYAETPRPLAVPVTETVKPVHSGTESVLLVELDPAKKIAPRATLYRGGVAIQSYVIAGPMFMPKLPFWGVIRSVEHKAPWCPTKNIRASWERRGKPLPPGCLPYGHPRHPTGIGFMRVDWQTPHIRNSDLNTVGAHGTKEPELLGTYPSSGCFRFHNDHWLALAASIGERWRDRAVEIHVVAMGDVHGVHTLARAD